MTPEYVEEALESATTEQLIAELIKRPTWVGVVIGTSKTREWERGNHKVSFDFSGKTITRQEAIGILSRTTKVLQRR